MQSSSHKRQKRNTPKQVNYLSFPVFFHIDWNRKFITFLDTIYLLDYTTHISGTLTPVVNSAKHEIMTGNCVRLYGLWTSVDMDTNSFVYF